MWILLAPIAMLFLRHCPEGRGGAPGKDLTPLLEAVVMVVIITCVGIRIMNITILGLDFLLHWAMAMGTTIMSNARMTSFRYNYIVR